MEEDDLFIEDIVTQKKETKKVNGKNKGKRVELALCKLLTKHFEKDFTRTVGSGNRWSQANLSETAKQVFSGDICVPEGFKWVLECKGGYEKDMLFSNVWEGIPKLEEFIKQVMHDSEYCGRLPVIMWKRNRKPWIVAIRKKDVKGFDIKKWSQYVIYKDWLIGDLQIMLDNTKNDFWFEEKDA